MFQPATTAVAELVFADRGGDTRQTRVHFPFSTPYATIYSRASAIGAAAQALSNGKLVEITVRYILEDDSPDEPDIQSDVGYYLVLYYSNDVDTEPVFIPSPRTDVLETTGRYAGVRLDLANPAVVSLADALTEALAPSLGVDLEPWGRVLVVGGRTR